MNRIIAFFSISLVACAVSSPAGEPRPVTIIDDGVAKAVIILADPANPFTRLAAEELQRHLQLASDVRLPLLMPAETERLSANTARLIVGPGKLTESLGVGAKEIPPQGYRIRTVGNACVFVGHDVGKWELGQPLPKGAAPATLYAVSYFFDRQLGARWLWPGALGT
jgi:hypothetical protein